MPETTTPAPRHLDYLDSARGIAASMVMIYHFISWKYDEHTYVKIASVIFNGRDAVSFFFVLSGFVLSYKYIVLDQPLDIKKFYIARFFRLWPAYFLIMCISGLNVIRNELSIHSILDTFIYNKSQFWEEAVLIRSHPIFYGPGWTLTVELALSFFIPFWVILAKKNVKLIFWFMIANLLAGGEIFMLHFLLGISLCSLFGHVRDASFKQTKWYHYRYIIICIGIILFSIRYIDRAFPFGPTYNYIAEYLKINLFFYTGIGSFIFIAAMIISPKTQKILRHRVLLYLGKVSYGIYLCHYALVTDIYSYWDSITPYFPKLPTHVIFICILCIYCLVTILLATIVHYTVELPFIRIGKKLASRLKPSFVIK